MSPTSTFYGLYSADGSHPSTSGSYLSACVLFAALTGDSPVGLTDNTTMDATLRLTLQQAAAEVVSTDLLSTPILGSPQVPFKP